MEQIKQDWQLRVIDEYNQLADKLTKLSTYKTTTNFSKLPQIDQNLLQEQWMAMTDYLDILELRIERFK